jgi:LAO/AO transport system kinase
MQALARWRQDTGHWAAVRAEQARLWLEDEVRSALLARLTADPAIRTAMAAASEDVAQGTVSPAAAAARVLARL